MSMSVPESVALPVASPLPGVAVNAEAPVPSADVFLEGRVAKPAHHQRPDHAAMLRRARAQ